MTSDNSKSKLGHNKILLALGARRIKCGCDAWFDKEFLKPSLHCTIFDKQESRQLIVGAIVSIF